MALYGYYKEGLGLFTNTSGTTWENTARTQSCDEALLIAAGFQQLIAYKLLSDSWQYVTDNKFALQPGGTDQYRFVDATVVSYVAQEYLIDATFFQEIQYDITYIL